MNIEVIASVVIVAVAVVLIILWAIATSNRFKVILVKIDEADSGIDVALTKRYDTLTKLIDVVKAFAKHETELFSQIVRLRKGMSMEEKSDVHHGMEEIEKKISILAEGYPELKSAENYKQLQEAISSAENHLQAARRVFNMNVSSFNQAIAVFPASIIAAAQRHAPREFFEADEPKLADVKVYL